MKSGKGKWVCAACLAQWQEGKDRPFQLLMLFDQSGKLGYVAYLGRHPAAEWKAARDSFTVLKMAMLMNELEGKQINNESLVRAITSLAQDAQRKLFQAIPLYVCTAQDPAIRYPNSPIYSRSERLTLRAPGTRYLAASLSEEAQQRQPIYTASTPSLILRLPHV